MRRRDFLKTGAVATGSLFLPKLSGLASAEEVNATRAKVWISDGDPVSAAQRLIDAVGGLESIIPADGVVLVKPNIAFAAPPSWGVTTDPDFLAAILDLCVQAGAKRVIVADHPVGTSPDRNLKKSGIGAVCETRDKVQMLMISERRYFHPTTITGAIALKETETAKILDKVDCFINLPTAKHHAVTTVSLGLKNLMGLIWDRVPCHEQMDLHQAIADIALAIKPHLTFLDARYSLLTNGPTGPGQVEETGRYLAGFDPVAVDAIGVELAAWGGRKSQGDQVAHLRYAAESGIGVVKRDQIDLIEV
ncbi:DUF362 domain-containing protein [bacterium]|nr:DUF362 domain-containing protein [bacterium]MBU1650947.1 DUF362 domain-containing protein [bacterium]MBU1881356.1 DUF362 domain-containing protein [bacterium]